jgi:hypothetical protein
MGKLPLDDPRWYPMKAALVLREQQTGAIGRAVLDLEQAMARGKPRCMRQDPTTGEREFVPAAFWKDYVIDFSILGSPTVYRRTAVDDTPHRWAMFAHAHLHLPTDRIYDLFYVWKPDFDQLYSGSAQAAAKPEKAQRKETRERRGAPPKFTPEEQLWLREKYGSDLKADRLLAKHAVAVLHVKQLAKIKFEIEAGTNTLLDHIIRPVLQAAKNKQ